MGERIVYGIGVGPGDPGLITLKAASLLQEADHVFYPSAGKGGTSRAWEIVERAGLAARDPHCLVFPMTRDERDLERSWAKAAERVGSVLAEGETGAFVTLGDPALYSTWTYLRRALHRLEPPVATQTVPGIPAFLAAASILDLDLTLKGDRLLVSPCPEDAGELSRLLGCSDTLVLYKIGRRLPGLKKWSEALEPPAEVFFASRVGGEGELVLRGFPEDSGERAGDLSLVIVRQRGAKA